MKRKLLFYNEPLYHVHYKLNANKTFLHPTPQNVPLKNFANVT